MAFAPRARKGWRGSRSRERAWTPRRLTKHNTFWRAHKALRGQRVPGSCFKAAVGLAELQSRVHQGILVAGGRAIADAAGIARSTWCDTALPRLEQLGLVTLLERGRRGRGMANVYKLGPAFDQVDQEAGDPAAPEDQVPSRRPLAEAFAEHERRKAARSEPPRAGP